MKKFNLSDWGLRHPQLVLFMMLVLTFILYPFGGKSSYSRISWPDWILIALSVALGLGYAAWNVGILHGNVSLLAAASYFTPVLSSALAAILLSATLSWSFWQGAGMVCLGSLLCSGRTTQSRRADPVATGCQLSELG